MDDPGHAFFLLIRAVLRAPRDESLAQRLEDLSSKVEGGRARLANTLRLAAARTAEPEAKLALLRRTAGLYEQLNATQLAADIHRRILALKADETDSLSVMISWHRDHQQWRDLRDRLQQQIDLTADSTKSIPEQLEIAKISAIKLSDPEAALASYGKVLAADPGQLEAESGLSELVQEMDDPRVRLGWLKMQVDRSEDGEASSLKLQIADLQRNELERIEDAIATLTEVVRDDGYAGPGYAPLAELLREHKRYEELLTLVIERAERACG